MTILKYFLKGFLEGKSLAAKWRKSANKSLSSLTNSFPDILKVRNTEVFPTKLPLNIILHTYSQLLHSTHQKTAPRESLCVGHALAIHCPMAWVKLEVLTAPKNFEMQLPFMDANASVKLSTSQYWHCFSGVDLEVSIHGGPPKWMAFNLTIPLKLMIWGYPSFLWFLIGILRNPCCCEAGDGIWKPQLSVKNFLLCLHGSNQETCSKQVTVPALLRKLLRTLWIIRRASAEGVDDRFLRTLSLSDASQLLVSKMFSLKSQHVAAN